MSEIKVGSKIVEHGDPFEVLKAEHHKMGRGGAVLKTKLRNLVNGNVIAKTFQGNDKAQPADLAMRSATYLYNDRTNYTFMDTETFDQFEISAESLDEKTHYIKENEEVDVLLFNDKPVNVQLPVKVDLQVISCPPGVKGNSVDAATKEATLETGLKIQVPLFVKQGDVIRVNTQTGDYNERV